MILLRTESGGTVTEQFDTSMIPDDAAYWDALSGRIAAAALRRHSVLAWLATSRRAWLVAASIGCAAAAGTSVLSRIASARVPDASLSAALLPQDRLARALLEPGSPPPLTALTLAPPASAAGSR